jgi:hypothetical protein
MPTLVSCPRSLTFPWTPTTAFSRKSSTVTVGHVDFTSAKRGFDGPWQCLDVDLEAHRQRGRWRDGRNDLVHPQHTGPQLLVPEGVVAEDGLPPAMLPLVIVSVAVSIVPVAVVRATSRFDLR